MSASRLCRTLLLALLLLVAPPLAAGARAQYLHLGWDECGPGAAIDQAFACDSNAGVSEIVASFTLPRPFPRFTGAWFLVGVCFPNVDTPDWWRLNRPDDCRWGSLTASFDAPTEGCVDLGAPAGAGSGIGVGVGQGLNGFLFVVARSVADTANAPDLAAGQRYFLARIRIDRAKSAGDGACAGCSQPAVVELRWLQLSSGTGIGEGISDAYEPAIVRWQGATDWCSTVVPTRNRTWGQVKTLYR